MLQVQVYKNLPNIQNLQCPDPYKEENCWLAMDNCP